MNNVISFLALLPHTFEEDDEPSEEEEEDDSEDDEMDANL